MPKRASATPWVPLASACRRTARPPRRGEGRRITVDLTAPEGLYQRNSISPASGFGACPVSWVAAHPAPPGSAGCDELWSFRPDLTIHVFCQSHDARRQRPPSSSVPLRRDGPEIGFSTAVTERARHPPLRKGKDGEVLLADWRAASAKRCMFCSLASTRPDWKSPNPTRTCRTGAHCPRSTRTL